MQRNLYPMGRWVERGIPVAFSSDGPVIDPNPWAGIFGAVTRGTVGGKTLTPGNKLSDSAEIDVETALQAYTKWGAMSEGSSQRKGELVPGALADLILVDADPTAVSRQRLLGIQTKLTIIGGKIAWEAKE